MIWVWEHLKIVLKIVTLKIVFFFSLLSFLAKRRYFKSVVPLTVDDFLVFINCSGHFL